MYVCNFIDLNVHWLFLVKVSNLHHDIPFFIQLATTEIELLHVDLQCGDNDLALHVDHN